MARRQCPRDRSGSVWQKEVRVPTGCPALLALGRPMHFDAARPRPGARSRSELADLFLTLAAADATAGRAESAGRVLHAGFSIVRQLTLRDGHGLGLRVDRLGLGDVDLISDSWFSVWC